MAPGSPPSSSGGSELEQDASKQPQRQPQRQSARMPADSAGRSVDATAGQLGQLMSSGSGAGYLNYSPSILLSLRAPCSNDTDSAGANSLHAHCQDYYDFEASDNDDRVLQPHVYEIATKAYFYLRRTSQDQAILFHSAASTSATGQHEQRRLATRALLSLSSNPLEQTSKSSRIAKQIQAAEFIIDAFGCVGSAESVFPTPRFGRYTELQFSEKGRIAGYKTLLHALDLDTGRIGFALDGVNGVQNKERSLEAVRWLAIGAIQDEREYLKLPIPPCSEEDARYARERFGLLKQAFKTFGFPKKAVAAMCSTLAAILHISSLQFAPPTKTDASEGCTISTPETLHTIGNLLGLLDNPATAQSNLTKLQEAFTNKTAYIDGEKCTVVLEVDQANEYKEQVAKVIYRLLWEWLGEFVNQKLCRDDFGGFVALLDFPALSNQPGHRNEGNSLSTLCINMATERIASYVTSSVFSTSSAETQAAEGLPSASIAKALSVPTTVAETVRILTTQPGGLAHIIDDQAVRKGKNEKTMLDAMGKRWGKNRQFSWRKEGDGSGRAGTFTIEHWTDAETVTYSTESFLEKNLNLVPNDLVDLLGGKAVAQMSSVRSSSKRNTSGKSAGTETSIVGGSSNSFVRELFANEVLAAAENERATLGTSQTSASADTDAAAGGLSVTGTRPARKPSMRRKASTRKGDAEPETGLKRGKTIAVKRSELLARRCIMGNFRTALDELVETLSDSCRLFYVFCLTPNTSSQPGVDSRVLKSQVRALQLAQIRDRCAQNLGAQWTTEMDFREFWDRYSIIDRWQQDLVKRAAGLMWTAKMEAVKEEMDWDDREFTIGKGKVFLNHAAFRQMEDYLRTVDQDEQKRKREFGGRASEPEADPYNPFSRPAVLLAVPGSPGMPPATSPFQATTKPYNHPAYAATGSTAFLPLVGKDPYADDDDRKTFMTDDEYAKSRLDLEEGGLYNGAESTLGFDAVQEKGALAGTVEPKQAKETVEVHQETKARKQWKFIVWCFTWWIPSFLLSYVGKMKRPDVRMAWREKVTIFMLIGLLCGTAVFVIAILGNLICPKEYVFSTSELQSHSYSNNQDDMLVSIRGEVFDLTSFAPQHIPSVVPTRSVQQYGGLDASDIFPVQVSALCNGKDGQVSPWVTLDTSNTTDPNAVYHDFRAFTNDSRADWYWEQMVYLRSNYRRGFMGYTKSEVSKRAATVSARNTVIYRGYVYDMTGYVQNSGGGISVPAGQQAPADTDRQFMNDQVVTLFQRFSGQDITQHLDNLQIQSDALAAQRVCLRNLFFIGKVDSRNSVQCQFSRYILLAFSIIMVSIIGFKFIAALQFGRARQPENHDRFVILQVPCYTEGEESLRECMESLAALKYDDKRKLLFVICDGMIIGSGNDRPTPRIVLDILGADPSMDPEPLSFQSLGEGNKQHNMSKIYSGLYEHAGHVIPYIVMVKVGKPSERSRPGNRGKRDSQMILMRFLNRVHFDSPMSPCELEIYHQIKNVIGVNPTFYEFLLAIDADTVVDPLSLNRFISAMVHDRKVIATCGETELSNSKKSMISMMQVYEYFISHHLAKAFESLFGSVTCLPGCFSLYRLRTVENKPVFIANDVVIAFGENRVDTLHMKNLLHLGEDRYLTTLLLKNFPNYKLTFTRDAHAKTIAPEEWKVLLSQRRRWINSTIHNLAELIGRVDRLCGFCCCSMRAVVLVDLLSTLIQPVTVAYIVYLIYLVAGKGEAIPTTALIMLGAIYGLQAIIFLLHRKFEMIVWMIIYILAIPVFSFALPVYSFWKQDDFSWGQTRVVLGEKGKKLVIHDEGEFDPTDIPLKSWHDYENELWEKGSNASIGQLLAEKEEAALLNGGNGGYAAPRNEGSIYGHESVMGFPQYGGPGSRPRTPMSEFGARSFHQALNSYSAPPMPGYATPGGHMYAHSTVGSMHQGAEGYELQQGAMAYNPFQPTHQSYASLGGQSLGMPLMHSFGQSGQMPSEEQLEGDIRAILARADLQTLTKKGVREELEGHYGVDLTPKKAFINGQIEQALSNLY